MLLSGSETHLLNYDYEPRGWWQVIGPYDVSWHQNKSKGLEDHKEPPIEEGADFLMGGIMVALCPLEEEAIRYKQCRQEHI